MPKVPKAQAHGSEESLYDIAAFCSPLEAAHNVASSPLLILGARVAADRAGVDLPDGADGDDEAARMVVRDRMPVLSAVFGDAIFESHYTEVVRGEIGRAAVASTLREFIEISFGTWRKDLVKAVLASHPDQYRYAVVFAPLLPIDHIVTFLRSGKEVSVLDPVDLPAMREMLGALDQHEIRRCLMSADSDLLIDATTILVDRGVDGQFSRDRIGDRRVQGLRDLHERALSFVRSSREKMELAQDGGLADACRDLFPGAAPRQASTSHDLSSIGDVMGNCIGSYSFSESGAKGESFFVIWEAEETADPVAVAEIRVLPGGVRQLGQMERPRGGRVSETERSAMSQILDALNAQRRVPVPA